MRRDSHQQRDKRRPRPLTPTYLVILQAKAAAFAAEAERRTRKAVVA